MSTEEPEDRRAQLFQELTTIGDLRPGSLVSRYRKCGKPNCRCAREGDPGHGPSWSFTRHVGGKSVTRILKPDDVERVQRAECQRLRRLTIELIEVSETLCEAREGTDTKKAFESVVAVETSSEVERLIAGTPADDIDMEAVETALKRKMLEKGARELEWNLNADKSDHVGSSLTCGCGAGRAFFTSSLPRPCVLPTRVGGAVASYFEARRFAGGLEQDCTQRVAAVPVVEQASPVRGYARRLILTQGSNLALLTTTGRLAALPTAVPWRDLPRDGTERG